MSNFQNIVLEQAELEIISVEALILNYWDGVNSNFHGCDYAEWIGWNENQIVLVAVSRKDKEIFNPFIMLFQVYILPLVYNKLEINLNLW